LFLCRELPDPLRRDAASGRSRRARRDVHPPRTSPQRRRQRPFIWTTEVHFVGEPDPAINTLGCRGIGEIGITGAAAAVANAVYHATGKRVRGLPITPDKLL